MLFTTCYKGRVHAAEPESAAVKDHELPGFCSAAVNLSYVQFPPEATTPTTPASTATFPESTAARAIAPPGSSTNYIDEEGSHRMHVTPFLPPTLDTCLEVVESDPHRLQDVAIIN